MRIAETFGRALLGIVIAAATIQAQARSPWAIDPSQTHVLFWIDAAGWPRTSGEFKSFEGHIDIDFNSPSRSRVEFEVVAKSVDVKSPSLNDYLCSEVFFNAAKFPNMRFLSTSVDKRDEHHAEVTGDLTMLGVTKPISLDVEVDPKLAGANRRVGFKATGVINRLDYGMSFGYPIISDLIQLTVTTEASAGP
jgi:polyisoprenoid-binding protein YceI